MDQMRPLESIQLLASPKMISSIINSSKLDPSINSNRASCPNARYCPLFIPKNAKIDIENIFNLNSLKRALELDLAVEDQPLAKISKKSKSEKGTTETVSKICFSASMNSMIKNLRINHNAENVVFENIWIRKIFKIVDWSTILRRLLLLVLD